VAFYDTNVPIAIALFAVAFSGIVAAYPALWAIPSSFLGASAAAASIGLINSFGNLGGFTGPYLIGFFSNKNAGSFLGGLWTMVIALFLAGLFALLVRKGVVPTVFNSTSAAIGEPHPPPSAQRAGIRS
jgi:ACS family tartrate transporter-like MFS transporter